jgi:hypothetical protein
MKIPERTLDSKLRSMFDLRKLILSLQDARLKTHEEQYLALFKQLESGTLSEYDKNVLEGLRYAFRVHWVRNDYGSIVQAGKNLPEDLFRSEHLIAAYVGNAERMLHKPRRL